MTRTRLMRPMLALTGLAILATGLVACGTVTPVDPVGPTPAAVSSSPTASKTPGLPSAPTDPPDAVLAAEGGDPVTGELGSYTWHGSGSDSPWLPGAAIRVGTGEPLTVSLIDGTLIGDWSARIVPAAADPGAPRRSLGTGSTHIAFQAPAPGTWSVAVTIRYAGQPGSATWYWELDVT